MNVSVLFSNFGLNNEFFPEKLVIFYHIYLLANLKTKIVKYKKIYLITYLHMTHFMVKIGKEHYEIVREPDFLLYLALAFFLNIIHKIKKL